MAKKLSRRDFLKLTAGAAASVGAAPVLKEIIYEPYLEIPDTVLPGKPTWYASTCRQCSAGCGILVKVVNGRAKKIEGNPNNPLNKGKLCARGQAGLQILYNPDRLKNAVVQTGGRGSRQFDPIQWSEALEHLLSMVEKLNPSRIAFITGQISDHLYYLISTWLVSQGAPPPLNYDLQSTMEGRVTESYAVDKFFASDLMPVYDIANADVIYSFGANFLETWQSPVAYGQAYGDFRQGQTGGRGYFVQFEPRLSATAAVADEWIPLSPGTDGMVALALGRIIVENNLGNVGTFTDQETNYFQDVNIGEISIASDISLEKLERLARNLASSNHPLIIPGGYPMSQQNGYFSYESIQTLNLILKRFGQPGGVYLSTPLPVATMPKAPPPDSFRTMQSMIERMSAGQVELLFIYGANPIFDLPLTMSFADAIAKVPYVVSFSSFIDDTAVFADMILPDHTYLEGWGYQVPSPSGDRPVVSNQQPVVSPLFDTRATGDIILDLAHLMGDEVSSALPWLNESLYLEDISGSFFGSSLTPYRANSAGEFWATWRQHGGWWSDREIKQEPDPVGFGDQKILVESPVFVGDENELPLHLYPYSSTGLSDGRGANQPWLQELPDPMTTGRWNTWIEINPQMSQKLGIEDNDIVKVFSPYGELEAVVVVYPGIRPDVVAMPVGQGHSDYGRYANNRGQNPIKLLSPVIDPITGMFAWGATRVRIEPTGRKYTLARLENLEGEGRETVR